MPKAEQYLTHQWRTKLWGRYSKLRRSPAQVKFVLGYRDGHSRDVKYAILGEPGGPREKNYEKNENGRAKYARQNKTTMQKNAALIPAVVLLFDRKRKYLRVRWAGR